MMPAFPAARHSARLVVDNERGVIGLCARVRASHDPWLMRFFAEAVCECLPMEDRLATIRADAGRGPACKLPGCGGARETTRHLAVCTNPEVSHYMAALVAAGLAVLRGAGIRVVQAAVAPCGPTVVVPPAGRTSSESMAGVTRWVPVWFDLRRRYWMEVLTPRGGGSWTLVDGDPLANVIGVLPDGLDRMLSAVCVDGTWRRRELHALALVMSDLQITLVTAFHGVYTARSRVISRWWESDAAAPSRGARCRQLASRARQRVLQAEVRARARFAGRQGRLVVQPQMAPRCSQRERRVWNDSFAPMVGPRPARRCVERRLEGSPRCAPPRTQVLREVRAPVRRSSRVPVPRDFTAPMVCFDDAEWAVAELLGRVGARAVDRLPWY